MTRQTLFHRGIAFVVLLLALGGCTGAPAAPVGQQSNDITTPSAVPTDPPTDEAAHAPASPVRSAEGYKPLVHCTGAGSPTVVLEHGMGGTQFTWSFVQPDVATFTRVCSYTRAQKGQVPLPRTSQHIVEDLHTILAEADIDGPYVLVGHSFGGYNVRLYADQYPDEVVGMVLVDASHEDWHERFLAVMPPAAPDERQVLKEMRAAWENLQNPEGVDWEASEAQVRAMGSLGDLPLVVLTSGRSDATPDIPADIVARLEQAWLEMQQELAALSTNSTHIIVEESGLMATLREARSHRTYDICGITQQAICRTTLRPRKCFPCLLTSVTICCLVLRNLGSRLSMSIHNVSPCR